MLIDYAAMRYPGDKNDLRIDLPSVLREDLDARKRRYYDVVAFTHLDDDHIHGASDFFYFEHGQKYQGKVDGRDRVGIKELWVPAGVITEEGCTDEDRVIRQEARYRLKMGNGIRVFSRPDQLSKWLESEGLSLDARSSLIVDAGQLVPGWDAEQQGVEFFVHSPWASRTDDGRMLSEMIDASCCMRPSWLTEPNLESFLELTLGMNPLVRSSGLHG